MKLRPKNGDRKGFKALFTDAAKHRFDVLLFWSLDRLTREGTFKTHCYLKQLTDAGVKFKSFTEQYVDSLGVFGDAIIGLLAAMAQQERIRISDRTKAGIARLKAAGETWKRGPNRNTKRATPAAQHCGAEHRRSRPTLTERAWRCRPVLRGRFRVAVANRFGWNGSRLRTRFD